MNARHKNRKARHTTWLLAVALLAGTMGLGSAQASPVDARDLDDPTNLVDGRDPSEEPRGPCSVVRKVGSQPSLSLDPLLSMFEVDPDHCIQRILDDPVGFIRKLIQA